MNDISLLLYYYPIIYHISKLLQLYMAFPPSHRTNFMFHSHEDQDPLPSSSLNSFPSQPPPQQFLISQTHKPSLFLKMGSHQFLNQKFLGGEPFMLKRSMSFSGMENKCNEFQGDGDLSDDCLQQFGEKKKRLNMEQVKALEKSFESGNKLEPERKVQLAKALGLQPRQIAIWFQNRRARWKTKQLEKEFEILKKQFQSAKADNDALMAHNQKLHAELQALKSRDYCETMNLKKETEGSWSNGSNSSSDINLDFSRTPIIKGPVSSQNDISLQSTSLKPTSITQFHPHSPRPELQDEGFSNMFQHIDEQQNFWPWHEQHHFQ